MRLSRVDILNFRSIKNIDIEFDPKCRVLVGINESGKSNILKALALLGDDSNPVTEIDKREALPQEDSIKEAYVRFVFNLEKVESDELLKSVSSRILSQSKNPAIVSKGGKTLKLQELCSVYNQGLYRVDINTRRKSYRHWTMDGGYQLIEGWKKPSSTCPANFTVEMAGKPCLIAEYKLIRTADLGAIPIDYLDAAKFSDLNQIVTSEIISITKANLPDTLVWEYSENSLLPSTVNIAAFSANPDSCVPLKNMFALAGHIDINASITEARKGTANQFRNFLDRVAIRTTEHFRQVWQEYDGIEFSLNLNADQIVPGVKEKNIHDFARRSDGFKRLVTFLLMISVNVTTNNLRDTLLLIDEPEVGLHPSSVRYLRDELIRISSTNYVVYSTHSIFMIDSGNIDRHIIVKKNDEVTSTESAGASNVADEELLFNALGYSVFDIIKAKNLIFEGWNDKRLFSVAMEKCSSELKKKFSDVGICHAKGVGTIKNITPMIELANRECLIISDNDKPAKEQQKAYRRDRGFGDWKTYQNIDSKIKAITGEDFVINDFIIEHIDLVLVGKKMPKFDKKLLPATQNKLQALRKWLTTNGMTAEQAKDTLDQFKHSMFQNLKPKDIDDSYQLLLQGIPV